MSATMATRVDPEIKRKFYDKAVSEGIDASTALKKLVYAYLGLETDVSASVIRKDEIDDKFQELNGEISRLRDDVDGMKYPLNSRDFEVLIDHAKKCDSDVCEIRDVWDKEVEEVKKESKKPYAIIEGEKKQEKPSEVKKEKKSNPNKEWSMWDRLSEEEGDEKASNPNEEEASNPDEKGDEEEEEVGIRFGRG